MKYSLEGGAGNMSDLENFGPLPKNEFIDANIKLRDEALAELRSLDRATLMDMFKRRFMGNDQVENFWHRGQKEIIGKGKETEAVTMIFMAQESFDLVRGCQDGIPKTTFSIELTRRIKEVLAELGEGLDVSNILFYTAITSPELKDAHGRHFISSLDALYGVDAFIDLVLPQGIVRITLDGSYKYKDFVKADKLIVWTNCVENHLKQPKEFKHFIDEQARGICEIFKAKQKRLLQELTN